MEHDPPQPLSVRQWDLLANDLGDIRDSLVTISLALGDFLTEIPSAARDEVLTEVERHLCRISEASRRNCD